MSLKLQFNQLYHLQLCWGEANNKYHNDTRTSCFNLGCIITHEYPEVWNRIQEEDSNYQNILNNIEKILTSIELNNTLKMRLINIFIHIYVSIVQQIFIPWHDWLNDLQHCFNLRTQTHNVVRNFNKKISSPSNFTVFYSERCSHDYRSQGGISPRDHTCVLHQHLSKYKSLAWNRHCCVSTFKVLW